jgi:hypothetical protein
LDDDGDDEPAPRKSRIIFKAEVFDVLDSPIRQSGAGRGRASFHCHLTLAAKRLGAKTRSTSACKLTALESQEERAMILYHFTPLENVPMIKAEGILPLDVGGYMTGGSGGLVWLTERPTTRLPDAERVALKSGASVNEWLGRGPTARFTVRIGSHDRRLVRYEHWLRAQKSWDRTFTIPPKLKTICASFWMYFGVIPPERFVECDKAGGES